MAIKCLKSEKHADKYYFKYTLDDTKLLSNGKPDPAYIRKWSFALPPVGTTEADYIAMMKNELPLLAQIELDIMTTTEPAPTPLTGF